MAQASRSRNAVVAAFEAGDELAVRRLGWYPTWEAAAQWWSPRQTCPASEFVPYVKLLGDEDPAAVLESFRELAGDWRPTPSQVRAHLHRREESAVNVGRSRDRAKRPEALAAVADALRGGERLCTCDHRPFVVTIDAAGVLRDARCGGLELGQVYACEDAGLIEAAA